MDKLSLNPNECAVCREPTILNQLRFESFISDQNSILSITEPSELRNFENSLLRLLCINGERLSKQLSEESCENGIEGDFYYCSSCASRNQRIHDLFFRLDTLNQQLSALKNEVEEDFRRSVHENFLKPVVTKVENPGKIRHGQLIRVEIAKGLKLVDDHCLDALYPEQFEESANDFSNSPGSFMLQPEVVCCETSDAVPTSDRESSTGLTNLKLAYADLRRIYKLKELSIVVKRLPPHVLEQYEISNNGKRRKLLMSCSIADCMEKFSTFVSRTKHIREVHGIGEATTTQQPSEEIEADKVDGELEFKVHEEFFREPEGLLYCREKDCPRQRHFNDPIELEGHIKKCHQGIEKPFVCPDPDCSLSFTLNRLCIRHYRVVHLGIKKHGCSFCDKRFSNVSNMKRHMMSHDNAFVCQVCNAVFKFSQGLRLHERTHNDNNVPPVNEEDPPTPDPERSPPRESTEKQLMSCPIAACMLKFSCFSERAQHIQKAHYDQDKSPTTLSPMKGEASEPVVPSTSGVKDKIGINSRITCPIKNCPRTRFNDQFELECHIKKYHQGIEKPFKCPDCGKCFSDNRFCVKHYRIVHLGIKKIICTLCGHKFHNNTGLRSHMRTHTGERPFICSVCPMAFTHSQTLRVHERIHANIRPFHCDQCGKSFYTSPALKKHVEGVHHKDKPHICEVCGKSFAVSSYLVTHQKKMHPVVDPNVPVPVVELKKKERKPYTYTNRRKGRAPRPKRKKKPAVSNNETMMADELGSETPDAALPDFSYSYSLGLRLP